MNRDTHRWTSAKRWQRSAERKIHFFAMDLPHSDSCLVQAYPAESSEAFCEGHRVSFELFGGVPRSMRSHPALFW
jgi:transposase